MSRPLVTVNTITTQLREMGHVEVPADALITPAARDRLLGADLPVRWLDATAPPPQRVALYLVGDGSQSTCQTLQMNLRRTLGIVEFYSCMGYRAGLLSAVKQATDALAECSQRKAAVVVRDGGIVQCIANREPHVRAVICDGPTRLMGYMQDLGVNLLILEREKLSLRQMQGMLETYVQTKPTMCPDVEAALAGEAGSTKCECQDAHR